MNFTLPGRKSQVKETKAETKDVSTSITTHGKKRQRVIDLTSDTEVIDITSDAEVIDLTSDAEPSPKRQKTDMTVPVAPNLVLIHFHKVSSCVSVSECLLNINIFLFRGPTTFPLKSSLSPVPMGPFA